MQPTLSVPPYVAVLEMVLAHWNSASICAVAKLGIADELESGPKTTAQLAAALNLHEDSLYRVLRALAGLGIFYEGENRTFSQTPHSEVLRTNATPSLRYAAAMLIDHWQFRSIQAICENVQNGRTALNQVFGMGLFEYLQTDPEQAFRFNRGMTDLSSGDGPAIVASYDFSGFTHIVDIGGGAGGLLATILASAPHLRGTLFDQGSVIEQAKKDGILAPFGGRCELAAGSFFEAVPEGADGYIMKHIMHDWEDEQAVIILGNIRRVINPKGKLLIADRVIGLPNEPDPRKFFDIAMMTIPGGRERTESEWNSLTAAAGFRITKIVPTPGPLSIIETLPI
jgi:hypothetical protein